MWIRSCFPRTGRTDRRRCGGWRNLCISDYVKYHSPDDWKDEDCRPDLSLREYDCIRWNRRKPLISFLYDADSAGTYFSWNIWNLCRIIRGLCGSSFGGNFKDFPGYLPQNESKSGIVGDSLVYGIGKDSRLTFLFYKTVIRFLK